MRVVQWFVAISSVRWRFQFCGADDSSGTCPAGGSGASCVGGKQLKCVKFRQTGGCDPKGKREKHGDKGCNDEVPPGTSGYCQCGVGDEKQIAREVTCDHRPFKCSTECLQYQRYLCVGWRQTGGCDADGPREPDNDVGCDSNIQSTASGFCECGMGRIVKKPGCENADYSDTFTCRDVCATEPSFYEELGLDPSAPEKVVKQVFRKLSMKYHPDKTRGDPVMVARFHAVREAYDVLNDQEQRGIYDAVGLKMLIESRQNKVEKGGQMTGNFQVDLETLYNGGEMQTRVNRKVICRGCADHYTTRCRECKEKCANEVKIVNVQMGPFLTQQQQSVPSKQKCLTKPAVLDVHIERGMSDGDTLTFKGMGEVQPNKLPGDIVIKLQEQKHATFTRVGVTLHTEITISLKEALLGFERTITHLDGRNLKIGYKRITSPYSVMKIVGEGMPQRDDPTSLGDLFVKIKMQMPADGQLSAQHRQFLEKNFPS